MSILSTSAHGNLSARAKKGLVCTCSISHYDSNSQLHGTFLAFCVLINSTVCNPPLITSVTMWRCQKLFSRTVSELIFAVAKRDIVSELFLNLKKSTPQRTVCMAAWLVWNKLQLLLQPVSLQWRLWYAFKLSQLLFSNGFHQGCWFNNMWRTFLHARALFRNMFSHINSPLNSTQREWEGHHMFNGRKDRKISNGKSFSVAFIPSLNAENICIDCSAECKIN